MSYKYLNEVMSNILLLYFLVLRFQSSTVVLGIGIALSMSEIFHYSTPSFQASVWDSEVGLSNQFIGDTEIDLNEIRPNIPFK